MQIHIYSYGARLRVKDGLFSIKYAVEGVVREKRYAPSQVSHVFMKKSTSLSTDAILLALKHDVHFIITDQYGFPVGRLYSHEPNSTSLILKAQAMVSCHPNIALEYNRGWLLKKLRLQQQMMEKILSNKSQNTQQQLNQQLIRHNRLFEKLKVVPPKASTFRGLEGSACRIYYYLLGQTIPERYQFARRSRRPAEDAFNAFLNYGFAILYTRVEEALLESGLNPYLGFMHRDGYRHKSLVYDFIEPFRPVLVFIVFQLFTAKKVTRQHLSPTEDEKGVYLSKEGKKLLLAAFKKKFDQGRVKFQGMKMTQHQIVRRQASHLSRSLLNHLEVMGAVNTPGKIRNHTDRSLQL